MRRKMKVTVTPDTVIDKLLPWINPKMDSATLLEFQFSSMYGEDANEKLSQFTDLLRVVGEQGEVTLTIPFRIDQLIENAVFTYELRAFSTKKKLVLDDGIQPALTELRKQLMELVTRIDSIEYRKA